MEHTLADAAKVAGLNKSTLFRAIKAGRLSARRLDDGSYRIDASELARVYDPQHVPRNDSNAEQQRATASGASAIPPMTEVSGTELAVLRSKVTMLEDQLARERELRDRERETILETTKETVEDLRRRLDKSEERILALAPPVGGTGVDKPVPATLRSSRGFLARLFGRSGPGTGA